MPNEVKVLLHTMQDPKIVPICADDNYSLGLCYLASYARKYSIKNQEYNFKVTNNITNDLESFHPDYVGIGSSTIHYNRVPELCKKIKDFDSNIKIIIGGHHITALPENFPEHADYAVLGEGERAFLDILEGRANYGLVKRPLIEPLDRIPFPARDLLDLSRNRWFTMISSRGCCYHCIYCSTSHFWGKVRYHSAKYVVDEIESLGAKHVTFKDDLFIGCNQRLYEIADLLEQRKLDVEIACSVRANLVNEELVEVLKRLNVHRVTYGAESGNERILNYLKCDSVSVRQNYDAIRLLKKHGFTVFATFIVGSPTETMKEAEETLKLIHDAPFDDVFLSVLTPFPGTPLFELYEGDGDWGKFDLANGEGMIAKGMTQAEIKEVFRRFSRIQRWVRLRYLVRRGVRNPLGFVRFVRKQMWKR